MDIFVPTSVPPSQLIIDTPNGFGSTNTAIRHWTNSGGVGGDLQLVASLINGDSVQINTNGVYTIQYADGDGVLAAIIGLSLNSAQLTTAIQTITTANRLALNNCIAGKVGQVSTTVRCVAGDLIRFHCDPTTMTTPNATALGQVRVTRVD